MSALHGLASLLHCIDPERWDSMARPPAASIADLIYLVHGELDDALAACLEPSQSS
ncbi:hypothetical protein [Phenylobacterium sp.]|uniref:hypothetical protein n=1 Tax=Phenylobacterium sp. TaxID=1871053 RepID=UPI002FCBA0B6